MRTITVWLSAFNETLATTTETASFLSWFLPLIASHGLFAAPLERLSFLRLLTFPALYAYRFLATCMHLAAYIFNPKTAVATQYDMCHCLGALWRLRFISSV